jgi:hypothetical protein
VDGFGSGQIGVNKPPIAAPAASYNAHDAAGAAFEAEPSTPL